MGIKRIVDTSFWTDDKVVEEFSPEDKLFMLYLMTNPHTTQLGIYSLNKKIMAFELGYSIEAVSVLLDRFETKYNIVRFSKDTSEIALKNSLRHSIVKGGKPVEDLLLKELKQVKNKSLLKFVYDELIMHDNLNKTVEVILNKLKEDFENNNDNDNDNDVSYHDSYHDSLEVKENGEKKPKEKAKEKPSPYMVIINPYTDNEELKKTILRFIEMRKTIKSPMTEYAVSLMLNKLDKLAKTDKHKIEILNQSIMNCWKGIFEIKDERREQYGRTERFGEDSKFDEFITDELYV